MGLKKNFKQPLLFGVTAIAIPVFLFVIIGIRSVFSDPYIFFSSYLNIPLIIGIVTGIIGVLSGDKETKTLSIIGVIIASLFTILLIISFVLARLISAQMWQS